MQPFVPQRLPIRNFDWEPLIPLIGSANRALAHYDGVLLGLRDPKILLSPLTTREAVLSSKIEGTQATLGEVLRFEAGDEPEQQERREDIFEIINYRRALLVAEGILSERPMNLTLLRELHSTLLDSVRGRNRSPGEFRTMQNWIGRIGTPIEEADFVPPEPMSLQDHLENWAEYYHADRPDRLVQLAVVHAQFEIIHPFLDGNGRIGRILIPLFLFEKKLLSRPMFYLSEYLESQRDEYLAKLRAIGRAPDAWASWVTFFLQAIEAQARANAAKARDVMDLYESLKTRIIELTHSQFAVPLLDRFFERPIFKSGDMNLGLPSERTPSRQSVSGFLRTLRTAGILRVVRESSGRRGQVLALTQLVNLCEGRDVF